MIKLSHLWFLTAVLFLSSNVSMAGEHHHPVGITDGVASVDVFADGEIIHQLTATAHPQQPYTVQYQQSNDGGRNWQKAITIDIGAAPHRPARTADLQIAGHGEQLLAAWSVAGTGFMDSGPLVTAISHDGGRSWSRGSTPADDNSTAGHSFVDLAVDGSGRFHAVWLDNRSGKQGLIYSNSDDGGQTWAANRILDPVSCECCWNTLIAQGNQLHILYRASSPRDMRLFSSPDRGATFLPAVTVGDFNWNILACPHVGGALSAMGSHLHAAVWTGVDGQAGVYYLHSPDHGATWGTPHAFPIPRARQATVTSNATRVTIATTADDGSGLAIWQQSSTDNGETWALPERLSAPDTEVAHPKAISTATGTLIFWTQRQQDGAWTLQRAAF